MGLHSPPLIIWLKILPRVNFISRATALCKPGHYTYELTALSQPRQAALTMPAPCPVRPGGGHPLPEGLAPIGSPSKSSDSNPPQSPGLSTQSTLNTCSPASSFMTSQEMMAQATPYCPPRACFRTKPSPHKPTPTHGQGR